MTEVLKICKMAKDSAGYIGSRTTEEKNRMLQIAADGLIACAVEIIRANKTDMEIASDKPAHFRDRLMLNEKRIADMANGLKTLMKLPDPIGGVIEEWTVQNGLRIQRVRVPLGVLAIIYEARPNVTADAAGLCLKTGNAIVLRGSRDAIHSNKAIVLSMKSALLKNGFHPEFIQLVEDTARESATELMKARGLIDLLIPRGSAALIKATVENAKVPVIETGSGNCHAYIESSADQEMAENIVLNGKLSRPSVCNALESLVVDRGAAKAFLPRIAASLTANGVEVVGCKESVAICSDILPATEEDFYTEYEGLKISVKIVGGVEEAIAHINEHSTKHSEVIITNNKKAAEAFLNGIDSAAVYLNASTRFTDGYEFGFGAEMGISTQKIHARGPMGLRELTSVKYKITGNGQIR